MNKTRSTKIFLPIIIGFAAFRFIGILKNDHVPPIHDPLSLHHLSRLLFDAWHGPSSESWARFIAELSGNLYPPLIHILAQPFLLLFGTEKGAEASLILYIVILHLSIYGIGRRLSGHRAGLLASGFALFVPGLAGFSNVYMVDYPLAAWVCLSICLMLRTDGFSKNRTSIFLGLSIAAGMLTKQTFPIFAGPAVVGYASWALIKNGEGHSRPAVAKNLLLCFLAAVALPSIYYLPRLSAMLSHGAAVSGFYANVDGESGGIPIYLKLLFRQGLGPVMGVGALLGFAALRRSTLPLLALWAVIPLLFIDSVHYLVSPRYLLPILPAFLLAGALGLDRLARNFLLENFILAACFLLVFAGFFVMAMGRDNGPPDFPQMHDRFQINGKSRALRLDWDVEGPTRIILRDDPGKFLLLLNSPYTEVLQWRIWQERPLYDVDTVVEKSSIGHTPPEVADDEMIWKTLSKTKFLLLHEQWKQGGTKINFEPPVVNPQILRCIEIFHQHIDEFEVVDIYPYPIEGGNVILYRRKSTIQTEGAQ